MTEEERAQFQRIENKIDGINGWLFALCVLFGIHGLAGLAERFLP